MASMGDFLSGPIANLILSYFGGQEQNRAAAEAKKANLLRYNQGLGIIDDMDSDLGSLLYQQSTQEGDLARGTRDSVKSSTGQLYDTVGSGYEKRTKSIMDYLNKSLPKLDQGYAARTEKGVSDYDRSALGTQGGYERLGGETSGKYRALGGDLDTGYGELEALVESLGGQAKKDIGTNFDSQLSQSQQDLLSRGLGGSTVTSTLAAGNEREKSAELRRLEDDLTRQKLLVGDARLGAKERIGTADAASSSAIGLEGLREQGTSGRYRSDLYAKLSDEELAQMARSIATTGDAMSTLSADELASKTDLGKWRTSANAAAGNDYLSSIQRGNDRLYSKKQSIPMTKLDWIYKRNDPYPSSNWMLDLANRFGQNSAKPPEQKTDWLGPSIGAAGSVASAAMLKTAAMICIDQESMIATPHGDKPLICVNIGDEVLNHERKPEKVIEKDCGMSHPERVDDFRVIGVHGKHIVITKEHIIDGKPASEWKPGDTIRIDGTTKPVLLSAKVAARPCGDLKLEDGGGYIANGFPVSSMYATGKAAVEPPAPPQEEPSPVLNEDAPPPEKRKRGRPRRVLITG